MKRRILAVLFPLLLLLLLLSLLSPCALAAQGGPRGDAYAPSRAAAAEGGPLLPRARVYSGQFADVREGAWYYPYVTASYEYGLLEGRGSGFAPEQNVTLAELLTLSARLRAESAGESIPAALPDEAWYAPYVSYLRTRGLLPSGLAELNAAATRAQLAAVFALSLPESCFDARNDALVEAAYASGGYIADVDESTPYQTQILWLYRQGLLVGMDAAGSYRPAETTTRAEVAAVVTRMADPSLRLTPEWPVLPVWSVAGTTLANLIEPPTAGELAGPVLDGVTVDALVRRMLAAGEAEIRLKIAPDSDMQTLTNDFIDCVKSYCEQMYNALDCTYDRRGNATISFSASCCTGEELARYREETMARAVEIHDMLWESGELNASMSQYEIARVYYAWLCDNCEYDFGAVNSHDSASHIAYSALLLGKAVCDGYTGAYNLFLKLEGIACSALINDTHIWTVATLDGTEYHIDVTWGDQRADVDWTYFAMDEADSWRAHPW